MAYDTGSGAYTLFGGTLSSRSQNIGYKGSGMFEQHGGTNVNSGWCGIGFYNDIPGTYVIHDGYLKSGYLVIGGAAQHAGGAVGTFDLYSGSVEVLTEVSVGRYGSGSLTQSGGELICTNNVEIGMRSGSVGVYTQSGGVLRANNVILNRDAGSVGRYIVAGGMASITNLTVANGNGREGYFTVVGTNAGVTVSDRLIIGASGTYEVTLSPDGFTAPSCGRLDLSSLCSLKINASELLPYTMDNKEITIMTFDTLVDPNKPFKNVTVETGTEYGELRSATVNYYPDRITLKVRVLRPRQGTLISIR